MEEKELIEQLRDLKELAKAGEDFKIKTRWHLERMVKSSKVEKKPSYLSVFSKKILIPASLIFVLIFGSSGTTVALAERSNPGDTLYTVKRFIEDTRLRLAKKPDLRMKLLQLFIKKRFDELKRVLPAGEIRKLSPRQKLALLELKNSVDKLIEDYKFFKEDGFDKHEIKILLEEYQKIEGRIKKEVIKRRFLIIRQKLLKLQKSSF